MRIIEVPINVPIKEQKTFLVVTELGRVRGKVSGMAYEITPKGLDVIGNFDCRIGSNKGLNNEAIEFIVSKNLLPTNVIRTDGYIDSDVKGYRLILIEGKGLNYTLPFNF